MRYATALLLVGLLCGCNRPPKDDPITFAPTNNFAWLTIDASGKCSRWSGRSYEDCWPLDHPNVIERERGEGWPRGNGIVMWMRVRSDGGIY